MSIQPVICFADDCPVNLKIFQKQALQHLNMGQQQIQTVTTIDEAISAINQLKVILLDYTFLKDERTGATIAQKIHAMKKENNPLLKDQELIDVFPIIIGYSSDESVRNEFLTAGAVECFKKPAQSKDLFAFIQSRI